MSLDFNITIVSSMKEINIGNQKSSSRSRKYYRIGNMDIAINDVLPVRDNSGTRFQDTFCYTVVRRDSIAT